MAAVNDVKVHGSNPYPASRGGSNARGSIDMIFDVGRQWVTFWKNIW